MLTQGTMIPLGSDRRWLLVALGLVVVGGIALAIVAPTAPVPVFAVLLAVPMMVALLGMPELAVPVAVFLLYINAPVVAARFHGAPSSVNLLLPILLLIPLVHRVVLRREPLVVNAVLGLMLLYLAVSALSAVLSSDVDIALESVNGYVLEGLVIYFLVINVVRTPQTLRAVTWALLLAGLFLGTLAAYQQATASFDNNFWGFSQITRASFGTGEETLQGEVEQPRLGGPLGDQNRHSQNMVLLTTLGVFVFWSERSRVLRLLAAAAVLFSAVGAALTFSRGAAVSLVLILLLMVAMRYLKLRQMALIAVGLLLVLVAIPEYGTRLSSLARLSSVGVADTEGIQAADPATLGRANEMLAAGLAVADYPVFGVGPGMFRYHYQDYAEQVGLRVHIGARESHNLFLGIAADLGLVGLAVFCAIVGLTLVWLHRERKRWLTRRPALSYLVAGYLFMLLAYLCTGLFLHLAYERFLWLTLALGAAAAAISAAEAAAESAADGDVSAGANPAH